VTERAPGMDDTALKFGLLMESAQAHQTMAESQLDRLRTHTQDLDGVVRDEIRRTLIAELQEVTAESKRAAHALQGVKHAANMRALLWSVVVALLSTAIPGAMAHWILPSTAEVEALRSRRDQLRADVDRLEQRGGRADLRHCGSPGRLCVRIDKGAPSYGEKGDYYIVQGY
jgi:hypothetical protein